MGNSVNKSIENRDENYNQKGGREERDESVLPSRQQTSPTGKIVNPNLKVFTLAESESATKNFNPTRLLDEDCSGKVFKGRINGTTLAPSKFGVGIAVAVKKYRSDSVQQWKTDVNLIGKFSHPNLIRLIGYVAEDNDHLLVYEYMPNGSLENQLFNPHLQPLSWGTRVRIAMDVARGLNFLHNNPENTVIHRGVQPANISLDEVMHKIWGKKLSNFDLAIIDPSNGSSYLSTQVMGSNNYLAPEYIATGHLYVKSDVYCFGVVLLEILTGLRSLDKRRPSSKHSLVDMCKSILQNHAEMKKIIDPRMGEYPSEGPHELALLIDRCIATDPTSRPSMSEVVLLLERISTISMEPKISKGSS